MMADIAVRPAYGAGMPYSKEPEADDKMPLPTRHHGSHDMPTKMPPRQHGTHDAPMKQGKRPGC